MSYLITSGRYAGLTAKSNNTAGNLVVGLVAGPGLVITLGAASADLIHQCPLGGSFYVTKIMWYQNTGANATLDFYTLSNALVPVPMFPTMVAINGLPGGVNDDDLPAVEFMLNSQAAPNGWDGNLYVTCSVAGCLISCEVAEKG